MATDGAGFGGGALRARFFIRQGGGSRGARAIRDPAGQFLPATGKGPLEDYRFRADARSADRTEQVLVRLDGGTLIITTRPNRSFDEGAKSFFERDWPDWLTGRIFDVDESAGAGHLSDPQKR